MPCSDNLSRYLQININLADASAKLNKKQYVVIELCGDSEYDVMPKNKVEKQVVVYETPIL